MLYLIIENGEIIKMRKIAVVCDSGTNIPPEYKNEDLFILPLKVVREGVVLLDGIEISGDEVISEMSTVDFKTSLASPGEMIDLYEKIKKLGYKDILVVAISSGLSGTFNAFRLAADSVEGVNFEFVDTLNISTGAGLFVFDAFKHIDAGKSLKETADILKSKVTKSHVYFCVGTLEYLIKGGRIGKVSGFVGEMLNLKPVITCDHEGIYATVTKARGKLQGVNKIIDRLVEDFKDYKKVEYAIAHSNNFEEVEYIEAKLREKLDNIVNISKVTVSPSMSVHAGPDLVGAAAIPVE